MEVAKRQARRHDNLERALLVQDGEGLDLSRVPAVEKGGFAGITSRAAEAETLRLADEGEDAGTQPLLPDRGDFHPASPLSPWASANCST